MKYIQFTPIIDEDGNVIIPYGLVKVVKNIEGNYFAEIVGDDITVYNKFLPSDITEESFNNQYYPTGSL